MPTCASNSAILSILYSHSAHEHSRHHLNTDIAEELALHSVLLSHLAPFMNLRLALRSSQAVTNPSLSLQASTSLESLRHRFRQYSRHFHKLPVDPACKLDKGILTYTKFPRPTSTSTSHIQKRMSTNGEARVKRRTSPISAIERPKKQLKQENGVPTPGDATPQNGSVYDVEDHAPAPIINALAAAGDSPEWQATIEKVIKSVVSIHFCQTCSFDTDLSTSSQATGFVVDAERGYILTNRHVVCAGPFWGYCVFDNHEEV